MIHRPVFITEEKKKGGKKGKRESFVSLLQRTGVRQGVAGAALAPGNKGSGRGQPGVTALRIGREYAQLGEQCCSWDQSKRRDGAKSRWCWESQ